MAALCSENVIFRIPRKFYSPVSVERSHWTDVRNTAPLFHSIAYHTPHALTMPSKNVPTRNTNSNSISCKHCGENIELADKTKCDDCKNLFHKSCIDPSQDTSKEDLIRLCNSCAYDNQICPSKSHIKTSENRKSLIPMIDKSNNMKSLRNRAISIEVAPNAKTNKQKTISNLKTNDPESNKAIAQLAKKSNYWRNVLNQPKNHAAIAPTILTEKSPNWIALLTKNIKILKSGLVNFIGNKNQIHQQQVSKVTPTSIHRILTSTSTIELQTSKEPLGRIV